MKKIGIVFLILLSTGFIFAQAPNSAFNLGLQADSDTYMGVILKSGPLELGIKAKWMYLESGGSDTNGIVAGAHLGYLFHGKQGRSSLGLGIDFRTALGELEGIEFAEYVDAFVRFNYNYHVSDKFMLSALFYPFSLNTREYSGVEDSFSLRVTIPSGALAAAVFF